MGAGPMTGGGRGLCNPAYAGSGQGFGREFGCGRGFGRGRGRGLTPGLGRSAGYGRGFGGRSFYPASGSGAAFSAPTTMKPQDEASMLRDKAEYLKQELDSINKRVEELESKSQLF